MHQILMKRDEFFSSDDVADMMKQMRPQQLAEFTLKSKWFSASEIKK